MYSQEFKLAHDTYYLARERNNRTRDLKQPRPITTEENIAFEQALQKEFANDLLKAVYYFWPDIVLRDWQKKEFFPNLNHPSYMGMVFSSGNNVGKTAAIAIGIILSLILFPFCNIYSIVHDKDRGFAIKAEILHWVNRMSDQALFHSLFVSNTLEIFKKDPDVTVVYKSASEYKTQWFWKPIVVTNASQIQGKRANNAMFVLDEASFFDSSVLEALFVNVNYRDPNKLSQLQTIVICGNTVGASGEFVNLITNPKVKKYFYVKNLTERGGEVKISDAMPARDYFLNVHGENTKVYQERVLSLFVPTYAVFPADKVNEKYNEVCNNISLEKSGHNNFEFLLKYHTNFGTYPQNIYGQIYIGVDPSGYGKDKCAFFIRNDKSILGIFYGALKDPFMISKIVYHLNNIYPQAIWCVEMNGVGSAFPTVIQTAGIKRNNIKYFYSTSNLKDIGSSSAAYTYRNEVENLYTGLMLAARKWIEDAAVIHCELLFEEMRRLEFHDNLGILKINKKAYRDRYKTSPDILDAMAHSFIVNKAILPDRQTLEKIRIKGLGCITQI